MGFVTTTGSAPASQQKGIRYILAGFVLTLASTLFVLFDAVNTSRLTDHVRAAYPAWSQSDINKDKLAIASYLVGFGLLGMIAWLWSAWVVKREKPWARIAVTTIFIIGTCLAVMNATVSGGAYDRIVPTAYGVVGLIPSLAGLFAVIQLWKRDV